MIVVIVGMMKMTKIMKMVKMRVDRSDGLPTDEEVKNSEKSSDSHLHALKVIANPTYHLVDAYPKCMQ